MNSAVVHHDSDSVRGPPTETTPLLSRSVPLTISESSLNLSSPNLETQIGFLPPGPRPSISHSSSACITSQKATTPLPRAQLVTLCLVRIVVPIAFSQIFPYINEFIAFLNVTGDPSAISIFGGLVESSFAVSQLLFIYHWARLSDRFGRRPIIITGTFGVALMTAIFGLAQSIPELLVYRSGFFGATSSVVHTVLGEITDSTNQAAAFPLYGVTGPVGSIIGPLVGGLLSNPAQKYPIFDKLLFSLHPYFLPCLISGIISLMGVALAYFFLDESLPTKRRDNVDSLSKGSKDEVDSTPSPNARTLLLIPIIRSLSLSGFALEMNGTSFVVLFVLFCYSPIQQGGLDFPPSIIGYALAFTGLVAGLTQLFLMPIFLRRFEAARIYTVSIAAWPFVFLILPFLNLIARYGFDEVTGEVGVHTRAVLWVGILIDLALSRIGGVAYPASMILIKSNVPSPSFLGSTNGLVQWFMCLSRCISAVFSSSAFAFSVKYNILGGYFWAFLYSFIAVVGWWLARRITVLSKSTLTG